LCLKVNNAFTEYAFSSGQVINKDKFSVFISKVDFSRKCHISSVLGIKEGGSIFNYFGVTIFIEKPKSLHLQPIADRIRTKLEGLQSKLISLTGRVGLIISITTPMLILSFQIYK